MKEKSVIPKSFFVTLGGQRRELRFRLRAIIEAQSALGADFGPSLMRGESKTLVTCLWAGLLHAEPELTEGQVYDWLEDLPLAEATKILQLTSEAVASGMVTSSNGAKKKAAVKPKKKAKKK